MLMFTVINKLLQLLVYPDIQEILYELRALEMFYYFFDVAICSNSTLLQTAAA